jgi:uncharacterized membrane protein
MFDRRALSNLGIHVYGLGAAAFGLVGLVWSIFASPWWPVQALPFSLPHREALAYIVAAGLLLGGVAMQWRRTAQAGVVVLTILYLMPALMWLIRVVGSPRSFGPWGEFLQDFSLVAAGMVAYSFLAPRNTLWTLRAAQIGCFLYGICVVSYGLVHFFSLSGTARMVPKWIPPGQHFWAVATGVFDLLAAIAILTGVLAVLASRLLTVMLIGFGALVWAPFLFIAPHKQIVWAGNAINLAFIGAAWVVADSIASRKGQVQSPQDQAA